MLRVRRITDWVEVEPMRSGCNDMPCLMLSRDEPGASDHGKRNPPGYVTLDFSGEAVFSISALRRALDAYEREEYL